MAPITKFRKELDALQLRCRFNNVPTIEMDRSSDDRLPKNILFGELAEGVKSVDALKKRNLNYLKKSLKKYDVDLRQFELDAEDRIIWHQSDRFGFW